MLTTYIATEIIGGVITDNMVVEDGTGIDGADSFITLDEFEAAHLRFYGTELAGDDAAKEAALRRAYFYMSGLDWKYTACFPTFGGTIPQAVKDALAILANTELTSQGSLTPNVVPGQQKILTKVGEIGWTATGSSGVNAQRSVVTLALDMLGPYLNGTAGSVRYLRRA